jgi:hypothetical protein
MHGNVDCAKPLLEHGARLSAVDALGYSTWIYWKQHDRAIVTQVEAHVENIQAMGLAKASRQS